MSDTQTPQGILALAKQYEYVLSDLLSAPGPGPSDDPGESPGPGKPGHHLKSRRRGRDHRRHHEPGYGGYLQSQGGPLHHGSAFRVPFLYTDDLPGTVRELKAGGIRLFAAHLEGRNNYEEEDYTGNTASSLETKEMA